jgi:hypothetical protein
MAASLALRVESLALMVASLAVMVASLRDRIIMSSCDLVIMSSCHPTCARGAENVDFCAKVSHCPL